MHQVERDGLRRMRWPRRLPEVPSRVWSDGEWRRLQLGYQAGTMDEKWTVFAEGQTVFCHRSWTGIGYFEVTFVPVEGGGWRIAAGKIARDRSDLWNRSLPGRRRDHDVFNLALLELVLSAIVLGEPAEDLRAKLVDAFPKRGSDPDLPAGYIEHVFLGQRSE